MSSSIFAQTPIAPLSENKLFDTAAFDLAQIPVILDGMGSEATIDLFTRIVRSTAAARNQDHLRIIIDNTLHLSQAQLRC